MYFKEKIKQNKLLYLYYIFGAFNLITIAFSLSLGHKIQSLYQESFSSTEVWGKWNLEFEQLEIATVKVNSPGNDIFDNGDLPGEKENYKNALEVFYKQFQRIEVDIDSINENSQLKSFFSEIKKNIKVLEINANDLFQLYEQGKESKALAKMSEMDNSFHHLLHNISDIRGEFSRLQKKHFDINEKKIKEINQSEIYLVVFFLITVFVVLIYGRKLKGELGRKQRELIEQQKSFLNVASLISYTDPTGVITHVNTLFCKVSQYSEDELVGRTHRAVSSGVHSRQFWEEMWRTISQGNIWKEEVCNRAKDGSLYWVESTIVPKKDRKGNIVEYASIRIDITEKKYAHAQMFHRSKLESIGEMAAGVGHEINNPLAIGVGNLTRIKKMIKPDELVASNIFEGIQKIEAAHERIRKIVDGLRTFARVDIDLHETISVFDALVQTLNFISGVYKDEGITITKEIEGENFFIKGNLGKMQQVMMNLINNAKDSSEKKEKRTIHISLKKQGTESILLSVSDNGEGVPESIKNEIFNPFFTTKEVGKGTGMGLSIVVKLVKEMKGELNFETKKDIGTTFSITLPSITISSRELDIVSVGPEHHLEGRALVVDDEEGIRSLLVEHLEDMGLIVDEADDGETALERVKEKQYDYICSDMKMARMQGDEFIQKAKLLPNGRAKYFIITGGVTTNLLKDGKSQLAEVADGQIQKPFTEESIFSALVKKEG